MTQPYRPGTDGPAWYAGQPYGQPVPPPPTPTVLPVRTNHAMHLVLSLITCGMWLPVWVIMAMINSSRTRKIY
ncbi:membrane protein [Mycobacterium phage Superchunk]|nr:membrane protein [Mycobacterium phage Superchunk]